MIDPFERLDRLYSQYGLGGGRQASPSLDPGLEASLLSQLANRTVPLISYVGESIDKPGRAVRGALDMITGGNTPASELLAWVPFSDAIGMTNVQDAAAGRDILENIGAPRNIEGFHPINNPQDALFDVLGFGTEIATDPLTYLTLGGSAVGKAGKIAKSAGVLPESAAGRAAGTLQSVVGDLMQQAGRVDEIGAPLAIERLKAIETAAEAAGYGKPGVEPLGDILASPLATEKLGGAWAIGAPWGDPLLMGDRLPGAGIYEAARELPYLGGALRASERGVGAVGRGFNQLFDSRVADTATGEGQYAARELSQAKRANEARVRGTVGEWAQQRRDAGLMDQSHEDELWRLVEGVQADASHPLLGQIAGEISDEYKRLLNLKQSYGINTKELDDEIDYAFRQLYEGHDRSGLAKAFNTRDPSAVQRADVLRGIAGGTDTIRKIARGVEGSGLTGDVDGIKNFIASGFGASVPTEKIEGMAAFLGDLSEEQLKRGAFAGDPVVMFGHYKNRAEDIVSATDKMLDVIKNSATPAGSGGLSIRQIFNAAGLAKGDPSNGALMRLADKMGVAFDDNILKMEVPKDIANDLSRLVKGYTTPEPVNAILKMTDSFTNLWKAGVLTRPARYVRDFVSGAWQNYVTGEFSPKMYGIADKMLRTSGAVDGVQKLFPKLGKTDLEVTEALRRRVYAQDLLGHYKGRDILGSEKVGKENTIQEVLTGMTGTRPFSHKDTAKKAVGMHPETTYKPWHVRGVGDQEVTRFAPAAAGEDLSYYTDSINRLAGWLNQVKRGVDDSVAASKTRASQVDYSSKALTRTESRVFARIAPFWRFTKGMVPWTLRELYEHPGGKMAKSLAAGARARDDSGPMPDRITSSLAIPLGEAEDGTKRFFTNLGVAYEDPLQLGQVGPGAYGTVSGTLNELLSRTNPLIKGATELATGQLLFGGGQDIRDADPGLGRAMSNVAQAAGIDGVDVDQFGILPEYLASATPYVGSAANTLRTMFDPRKDPLTRATNLLTGFKFTDVSPQAQNRVINDMIRNSIRDAGGSVFETPYLPESSRNSMPDARANAIDDLLMLDRQRQREIRRERAATQ